MARTEISDIGKQALITRLYELSGLDCKERISIRENGEVISASKMILEGIDFDLVYTPLKHLGYKAALGVFGEIYAGIANPVSLSVSVGLSKRFCTEDVEQLWEGMTAACKEHGVKQVTLDLNSSLTGLCISLSSCGTQKKETLDKIQPTKSKDLICLTGHLGAAYMGLHVLEREKVAFTSSNQQPDLSRYKAVLGSYLSPEIKPDVLNRFIEAGAVPSRGYFLTRGLGEAVLKLTRDTGLGAKIYIGRIPISSQTFAMAEELDIDAVTAAMNGGDDYKFIFILPLEKHETLCRDFQDYDIIGHLAQPEVGAVLVAPEGTEFDIKAQGF